MSLELWGSFLLSWFQGEGAVEALLDARVDLCVPLVF